MVFAFSRLDQFFFFFTFQGHPSARHSAVDWARPDLNKYPDFAKLRLLETILLPGDVIYLPTAWFHYIVSLDFNVQVTLLFVVFSHVYMCLCLCVQCACGAGHFVSVFSRAISTLRSAQAAYSGSHLCLLYGHLPVISLRLLMLVSIDST